MKIYTRVPDRRARYKKNLSRFPAPPQPPPRDSRYKTQEIEDTQPVLKPVRSAEMLAAKDTTSSCQTSQSSLDEQKPPHQIQPLRKPACIQRSLGRKEVMNEFYRNMKTLQDSGKPLFIAIKYLAATEDTLFIKEFAATCAGTETVAWVIADSPSKLIPCEKYNRYLFKYIHGVQWQAGFIRLWRLCLHTRHCLWNPDVDVYVKSETELELLVTKLNFPRPSVHLLEATAKSPGRVCHFHERYLEGSMECAVEDVVAMAKTWLASHS